MSLAAAASVMDEHAQALIRYLEDVWGAPEALWHGALSMTDQAVDRAREGRLGRWATDPRRELRRFEGEVEAALKLAEIAVECQEARTARYFRLDDDLVAVAREQGKAARRAQTVPAELARRVNAEQRRRQRDGLEPSTLVETPDWRRRASEAIREGRPLPPS